MENESKTPAASLTGVELCERVALGMGWTQKYGYGMSVFVDASGFDRGIPLHNFERVGIARDKFFRPDLDGNHLAEVKADCERRGWCYSSGCDPRPFGNVWAWDPVECRYDFEIGQYADAEALAFLRAFVAASEAEKEKIQ